MQMDDRMKRLESRPVPIANQAATPATFSTAGYDARYPAAPFEHSLPPRQQPPHLQRDVATGEDRHSRRETRFHDPASFPATSVTSPPSTVQSQNPVANRKPSARAPRPSIPFGHYTKDNEIVPTSIDEYLENPEKLTFRERMSLVPKTEEYPAWNGNASTLLAWFRKVDTFMKVNQVPENLLLAKFHVRLTGEAQDFFQMRVEEDDVPCSWNEWKEAFRDRFLGPNWKREQQELFRELKYTGQEPQPWLRQFIQALRCIQPHSCTAVDIQDAIISKVPRPMAVSLLAAVKGNGPMPMSLYAREFEETAYLHYPHGWTKPSNRSVSFSEPTPSLRAESRRPSPSYSNAPRAITPSSGARPPRPATPPSTNPRRCFNCGSNGHVAKYCPQPPQQSRPAVQALAETDAEEEPREAEEMSNAGYESSSDRDEDDGEVDADGSGYVHALSLSSDFPLTSLLPGFETSEHHAWDPTETPEWPATEYDRSGSWDDDFYVALPPVLAVGPPSTTHLDFHDDASTSVLSLGHDLLDPASELAEAGAPVILSLSQALKVSKTVPTTDAPMRTKGVNSGRAFSTALSLATLVLVNGHPASIFLDTGAAPSIADASTLNLLEPEWRRRLKPLPKESTFTAFGSTLRPLGTVRSCLVFPHPAGCIRITVEFAVIDEATRPIPFILGMDWMLTYGFNIMLEHGPYFTIGRNKQRYGIATKTGIRPTLIEDDDSTTSHVAVAPTVAALTMGRPTPEPAEFERAVARMKISDELTTEQHMGKLPPRIKQNAYPASPRAREAMKRCVDEFLDIGIARLVVNYKVLNSATTPDAYPMPRIDETLYSLPFATPFGQFEYTRMPMGLRNAPAEFQRRMDTHFREEIRAGWISIYIDDLLIRQLGHRVSGVLLGIDDHKVAAVKEWRTPANRNELHARQTASLFYTYILNDVGVPNGIISDRDKLFTSTFWRSLASLCGYRLQLSTSYHPQTDGLAERHIRTIEDALRRFLAFDPVWTDESGFTHDWTELLPGLEFAMNSAKHATLDMLLASQSRAATCIADAVTYAKQRWDEKHVDPPFEVGDEVMLSSKHFHFKGERKLIPPFVGPFGVLEKVGPNAIRLALTGEYARKHPVFPVSLAKPYHRTDADRFPGRRQPAPPQPDIIDGQAHWVVEKIIDERRPPLKRGSKNKTRVVEYLVKWEGRPDAYNRWVPAADLYNAKEALQDYLDARSAPPRLAPAEDETPTVLNDAPVNRPHPEASPHMTRSRTIRSS
ncbi:hypothetical protein JCM5296_006189 [Sporobolomyces johnsonii]